MNVCLRNPFGNLDWRLVHEWVVREAFLVLRGPEWRRLVVGLAAPFLVACLAFIAHPAQLVHRLHAGPDSGLLAWVLGADAAFWYGVYRWSGGRMRRAARSGLPAELWLAGCGIRLVLLAQAIAHALLVGLLAVIWLPGVLLICAARGLTPDHAAAFCFTLFVSACLAVGGALAAAQAHPTRGAAQLLSEFAGILVLSHGLAKLLPQFGWMSTVSGWVFSYNPLAATFAAMGIHGQHWRVAVLVSAALSLFRLHASFRALPNDAPPESGSNRVYREVPIIRITTWREWDGAAHSGRRELPVDSPLEWWEQVAGTRVQFGAVILVPAALFAPVFIFFSLLSSKVAMILYWLGLWTAAGICAQNACAAAAGERENGRWPELLLTRIRAEEWMIAKLRRAWASAAAPMVVAAGSVVRASLAGGQPSWNRTVWALLATAIVPSAACVGGAVIGLRSRSAGEGYGRTAASTVGVTLLLALIAGLGFPTGGAEWLWPIHTALLSLGTPGTAGMGPGAWVGLALWLAGAAIGWTTLRRRCREWALQHP